MLDDAIRDYYARVPIGYVLYRHAIAPGASLVHLNPGVALERIDRYNEAIANCRF